MIFFRDFVPKEKTRKIAFRRKWENLEETMVRVNDWLKNEQIKVISVETLVMPNRVKSTSVSTKTELDASTIIPLNFNWWQQVIRVWYEQ